MTTDDVAFSFPELPLNPAPQGVSILLTGSDTDALQRVFYHLITARSDERSLVLATEMSGDTVNRALDSVASGASTRSTVITCGGLADQSTIDTVEENTALSNAGMQFSALVTESGTVTTPQRAGILISSNTYCGVTNKQSVSRFVHTNFLRHLRRKKIMGVCGIDISGASKTDVVDSMSRGFSVHLRVEVSDRQRIKICITGSDRSDESISVELPEVTPPSQWIPESPDMTQRAEVGD